MGQLVIAVALLVCGLAAACTGETATPSRVEPVATSSPSDAGVGRGTVDSPVAANTATPTVPQGCTASPGGHEASERVTAIFDAIRYPAGSCIKQTPVGRGDDFGILGFYVRETTRQEALSFYLTELTAMGWALVETNVSYAEARGEQIDDPATVTLALFEREGVRLRVESHASKAARAAGVRLVLDANLEPPTLDIGLGPPIEDLGVSTASP